MRKKAWLFVGVGIKRWLAVVVAGVLLCGFGFALLLNTEVFGQIERWMLRAIEPLGAWVPWPALVAGTLLVVLGLVAGVWGLRQASRALVAAVWTGEGAELAYRIYDRNQLQKGPKVVAIGGGTGLSTLLRGLKLYTSNITAIVTVADDGGSSGRLRRELGIPPPGDVRNTLVALADTEPLMEKLFQYRFDRGEGLQGHTFGNLFIASLTEVTGDFERAIRESSRVLAVRGRVLPSTLENVRLRAVFADGSEAEGESEIPKAGKRIRRIALVPPDVRPMAEALQAIAAADGIVIGPGSLYTSVLPNLLIPELAQALRAAKGRKIFVCNIMTQPGETDGYSVSQHLLALKEHVGELPVDICIINGQPISPQALERYGQEGAHPVVNDLEAVEALGVRPVVRWLLDEQGLVRHHPQRLAAAVLEQIVNRWAG